MYRGTSLSTQFHDKIMVRGRYQVHARSQAIGHTDAFKVIWMTLMVIMIEIVGFWIV